MPGSSAARGDAARVVLARGLRGFADGFISVVLALYLQGLGFSPAQVGALITAALLGSALLTLAVGLRGGALAPRRVLLGACALMFATGLGFAGLTQFWPLLAVAFAGTLNPSAGDVSVFLPTEQALLARGGGAAQRTRRFAHYNLCGALLGAFGALAAGVPEWAAARWGLSSGVLLRGAFALYAVLAVPLALLYAGLAPALAQASPQPRAGALVQGRAVVLRLAALFALDSFGSGLAVQSLLALWLYRRFGLSSAQAGAVFFAANAFNAGSQLLTPLLARRIGLVETMVFTHLPANVFLMLAPCMPSAPLAIACLLARTLFSQMDVPARQAYVMSLVPAHERSAAAGITNVPRSLAAAGSPLLAGWLLEVSNFGWPLLLAGAIKVAYDLLLLAGFRRLRPAADDAESEAPL